MWRVLLAFHLFCVLHAVALAAALPPTLNFEQVGVREGLAQQTVTAIVQDQQGYMWFGSQHGLSRYDGYRVIVYRNDPNNARSLADNWVQVLHVDNKNRLWVGTRGGLQRFNPATGDFTAFPAVPNQPDWAGRQQVQAIVSDGSGKLWLGTSDGLHHFNPESGSYQVLRHDPADGASLANDRITALALDARGGLWVGLKQGLDYLAAGAAGFRHFRIDTEAQPNAPLNEIVQLRVDQRQILWLITMDGLVSWQPGVPGAQRHVFGPADGLGPGLVTAMMQDREDTLWLGTNTNGLHRWDADRQRFVQIPADPHRSAVNEVSTLFQDRTGTLWVGTWTAGVRRVDLASGGFSRYFHVPGDPRSLHDNRIYGICGDGSGGLLLASMGGIDHLDPVLGKVNRLRGDARLERHMHNKEIVLAVHRDARGVTWIGSSAELARFDPERGTYAAHRFDSPDPNSNSITHITGDRSGNLWVSSRGGLHRIDGAGGPDRSFRHDALDPHSLSDDWVRMTAQDASGNIWVATDHGLNMLEADGSGFHRFQHVRSDSGSLSNDRVQSLFVDRQGTLWVGTNGGLNRVERAADGAFRFRRYTRRDGLADDSIGAILQAGDGALWLSTATGISRMALQPAAFKNYSSRDGMIEGYYFSGSAYQESDGTMYFGGENGLTVFHPARVRDNPYPAPAVVTAVMAGNQAMPTSGSTIGLAYDGPALSFEFAALHYSDPQRNRFRYRLNGYDRDWTEHDASKRTATYTNLDPGSYQFQVKAANKDGIWGPPSAPLAIEIAPPYWRRWTFLLAATLSVPALAWACYRMRESMHARRERELKAQVHSRTEALQQAQAQLQRYVEDRERLFLSISHDLRTPITRLKLRSELLNDAAVRTEFREDLDDLDMMVKGALQTVKDSDIYENTALVDLDALIGRMLRGAELEGHQIGYTPSGIGVPAKPLALKRAIGNLLDNALFYGGRADISVEEYDGVVHIQIRDDGPGVLPEKLAQLFEPHVRLEHGRSKNAAGLGLGLGIARAIIEDHEGMLVLQNHPEGGLVATVLLPGTSTS